DSNLIQTLLGGGLGNFLAGVVGVVVGGQIIQIRAYTQSGSTSLFTWDSSQASNPQNVRVVSDKDGNNYVAIKLNQAFRRIRVKSSSTALLGLASKEYKLDVYHAFYYVADPCDIQPAFTSFDGSGL